MKLVVIGGVAAGASCAARARRLDEQAEIVMLEKGRHVSFANCGLPYHIGGSIQERDRLLLQTPESLKAILNLDVRVGHEVTAINREAHTVTVREAATGRTYEEAYDKLALCPGAVPLRPPLPGIDLPQVHVLRNVDDMDAIIERLEGGARRAVVIGGGYIGVEMAENLAERGLQVALVEMADQIMTPLDREMARDLEQHMQRHGVALHLGAAAAAFVPDGDGVRVELKNGETLAADLVVMAAGVKPDGTLARQAGLSLGPRGGIRVNAQLQTDDPDIYAGGDAVEVVDAVTGEAAQIPLAGPANRQGRSIADHIYGRPGVYTATQGTAIVKVFDMTGGGTGASEKTLKRLGRPYRKLYLHPSGHAGYYPGTAPLHLKVLMDPEDGRLLGAQVVGYDGVDKRIDVLATAIRAGMTVRDLQELELAYAPPYGSAKDPVNMAGFVGANLLDGDVAFWYPEDFPARTDAGTVVDVRSKDEYDVWHVPGAVNIPLGRLRLSLDGLDRSKPVFVYCRVGFRSYLAYRLLKQHGFEQVATLAGGTMTFCSWHGAGICSGEREAPPIAYAEEKTAGAAAAGATVTRLDLRGLQCPGPIRKLVDTFRTLAVGDEVEATASDAGFAADAPAWCASQGHTVVDVRTSGAETTVRIRKGAPGTAAGQGPVVCRRGADKKTMVVFSGDLDRVLAAFIIANGAASMGSDVTLFFTFWGLNALRREGPQAAGKGLLDRLFGMMMPAGARRLGLSRMHMLGMGTAMMKHVMRSKRVDSLPELMRQAREAGVKLVACSMSMDVMGIRADELIDGVEYGGVAAFLGESQGAGMTLFI